MKNCSLKWISFSPVGINELLTLLLSLSQVEKPLLSLYWSPKNQVSLSPIVFTIYAHDTDNMTRSHLDLRKHRSRRHARHTWSKSCLPVVLGRMANSSSASMVVTRTFICQRGKRKWTLRFRRTLSVLCHWTSLNEQQLVKATAIIALVLRGKLVL